MVDILETDDNIEVVASTIESIYDQTCRSCGLINHIIIFQPDKNGKVVANSASITSSGTPKRRCSTSARTNDSPRQRNQSPKRGRKMSPARRGDSGLAKTGVTRKNHGLLPPRTLGTGAGTEAATGQHQGLGPNMVLTALQCLCLPWCFS